MSRYETMSYRCCDYEVTRVHVSNLRISVIDLQVNYSYTILYNATPD